MLFRYLSPPGFNLGDLVFSTPCQIQSNAQKISIGMRFVKLLVPIYRNLPDKSIVSLKNLYRAALSLYPPFPFSFFLFFFFFFLQLTRLQIPKEGKMRLSLSPSFPRSSSSSSFIPATSNAYFQRDKARETLAVAFFKRVKNNPYFSRRIFSSIEIRACIPKWGGRAR